MQLNPLTETEISEIYQNHLVFDFPADEVKPLGRILQMLHNGIYFAFGLFEDDVLRGYAFFVKSGNGKAALLDYFAVLRGKRGGGIGSRFLALLRCELQNLDMVLLESEAIDAAENEEETTIRTRRIAFYLRNGVRKTGVRSVVFGVEYEILCMDCAAHTGSTELRRMLDDIYHQMFFPDFADKFSIR
ncbi:MAG: GNAT family N-acetyltransferase [Acutalibacteraceae bacterium]|jgi:GNAT superfamily N-acetyltransferase